MYAGATALNNAGHVTIGFEIEEFEMLESQPVFHRRLTFVGFFDRVADTETAAAVFNKLS